MTDMSRETAEYRWGYHVHDLDRAVVETREILISVARQKTMITYTDLCRRLRSVRLDPHSHALAHVLGRVSSEEDRRGRGMLSALGAFKGDRASEPAVGFSNIARDLGYDLPDRESEEIFWLRQVEKVYADHGRRGGRR